MLRLAAYQRRRDAAATPRRELGGQDLPTKPGDQPRPASPTVVPATVGPPSVIFLRGKGSDAATGASIKEEAATNVRAILKRKEKEDSTGLPSWLKAVLPNDTGIGPLPVEPEGLPLVLLQALQVEVMGDGQPEPIAHAVFSAPPTKRS